MSRAEVVGRGGFSGEHKAAVHADVHGKTLARQAMDLDKGWIS